MKATIKIQMDNAAFDDNGSELARILRSLAEDIDRRALMSGDRFGATDRNGNRVGDLKVMR